MSGHLSSFICKTETERVPALPGGVGVKEEDAFCSMDRGYSIEDSSLLVPALPFPSHVRT